MSDAPQPAKSGALRWMLGGLGGGAGVTVGVAAIEALRARPEFLPQLLSGGFLGFASLIFGMVLFRGDLRKQFEIFNSTQERHVVAQEQLALNVGALVAKDDQRTREQELTLNHLARQSDAILEELQSIKAGPVQ